MPLSLTGRLPQFTEITRSQVKVEVVKLASTWGSLLQEDLTNLSRLELGYRDWVPEALRKRSSVISLYSFSPTLAGLKGPKGPL